MKLERQGNSIVLTMETVRERGYAFGAIQRGLMALRLEEAILGNGCSDPNCAKCTEGKKAFADLEKIVNETAYDIEDDIRLEASRPAQQMATQLLEEAKR